VVSGCGRERGEGEEGKGVGLRASGEMGKWVKEGRSSWRNVKRDVVDTELATGARGNDKVAVGNYLGGGVFTSSFF